MRYLIYVLLFLVVVIIVTSFGFVQYAAFKDGFIKGELGAKAFFVVSFFPHLTALCRLLEDLEND